MAPARVLYGREMRQLRGRKMRGEKKTEGWEDVLQEGMQSWVLFQKRTSVRGETTNCVNSTVSEGLPRRIPAGFSLPLVFFQKKVKLTTKTLNNFQRPRLRCQLLENKPKPKLLWRLARLIFITHLLFISNPPAIKAACKISSQSQGILLSWEAGPTHPWSTCYLCNETPSPFLRLSHSWTLSLKVSSRVLVMVMTTDPSLEQFHRHFCDNVSLSCQ